MDLHYFFLLPMVRLFNDRLRHINVHVNVMYKISVRISICIYIYDVIRRQTVYVIKSYRYEYSIITKKLEIYFDRLNLVIVKKIIHLRC